MFYIDELFEQAVKLGDVKITKDLNDTAYMCIIVDRNGNQEIGINNSAIKAIREAIDLTKANQVKTVRVFKDQHGYGAKESS